MLALAKGKYKLIFHTHLLSVGTKNQTADEETKDMLTLA